MHKGLQDFLADEKKMKPASELQEQRQNESNDMEWNAFGDEEMQEPFQDYRLMISFFSQSNFVFSRKRKMFFLLGSPQCDNINEWPLGTNLVYLLFAVIYRLQYCSI